jgi:hypothetical protein
LLDRSFGLGAGVIDGQRQLGFELALAQQAHAIERAADEAGGHQHRGIHGLARIDQLGIHRRLQAAQIDLVEFLAIALGEAALGQAPVQRHLAALETAEPHAAARGLALAAAATHLAHP